MPTVTGATTSAKGEGMLPPGPRRLNCLRVVRQL
jgi:hypothetical protein